MEGSHVYFSRKQCPTANRGRGPDLLIIGENALFADNTNAMQDEFLWNVLRSPLTKVLLAAAIILVASRAHA
jgi:hypothetical protein